MPAGGRTLGQNKRQPAATARLEVGAGVPFAPHDSGLSGPGADRWRLPCSLHGAGPSKITLDVRAGVPFAPRTLAGTLLRESPLGAEAQPTIVQHFTDTSSGSRPPQGA